MKLLGVAGAICVLGLVTWLVLPVRDGPPSPRIHDLSNMKQLALGFMMYIDDHDDRLPLAENWTDQADGKEAILRCASLPKDAPPNACGHVMERSMPGQVASKFADPNEQALVFDGVKFSRNATDSLLGIDFSRHQDAIALIAYVDGHAKAFRPRGFPRP